MGRLLPFSYRAVPLGEYPVYNTHCNVAFNGRDRAHVKRKALDYWVQNQNLLRLSMRDFFERCRLSPDGRAITFRSEIISSSGPRRGSKR